LNRKTHKLKKNNSKKCWLIGLSSHQNDYRLSWALNNALDITLNIDSPLTISEKRHNRRLQFSVFSFEEPAKEQILKLVSNRTENGFLLPRFSSIDFFICLSGKFSGREINDIIENIKEISFVLTAYLLDMNRLTKIQKAYFE
jgi:hypothetical protein